MDLLPANDFSLTELTEEHLLCCRACAQQSTTEPSKVDNLHSRILDLFLKSAGFFSEFCHVSTAIIQAEEADVVEKKG